ncbi:Uncharacterized protein TCAP_07555, partial [Tolypocladium capitatum]
WLPCLKATNPRPSIDGTSSQRNHLLCQLAAPSANSSRAPKQTTERHAPVTVSIRIPPAAMGPPRPPVPHVAPICRLTATALGAGMWFWARS